jgi:hypothetical protein
LHRKLAVPGARDVSVEIYRDAERYITVSGNQIGDAAKLASIDVHIDAVMSTLAGKAKSGHDLDALIRDSCGDDFGGDRSRALWYVINQLPKLEIKRLARLSAVQYERERKPAAERLGIRSAILDRLVQAERPNDDSGKQGRPVSFAEPEPWPDPVGGAGLLDAVAEAVSRYVVLPEHSRDTAALWVLHTYLLDCFLVSPRLCACSPIKRCGKTTLLDVLAHLVLRPLPAANVTSSAIFRVVEAHRPTLLIDEADTFVFENDELRGVVNSGHRRGGSVLRIVGDDHQPHAFSTYSACAIALIGQLPDTLQLDTGSCCRR